MFYFVLAIYQLMKDLMQVFRYHYFTLWCMMYLLFVNIPARVSLCNIDISSKKSEIAHKLSVIFQKNSLSNYPYFLLPGCTFDLLLYFSFLLRNALSIRKALSTKQLIKASVGTRKFLSEFYLEVLWIEFDIKLLLFVSFKRISSVKIHKICDALLPLM